MKPTVSTNRSTLADEVAQRLKDEIISTEIGLGELLSVDRIATRMGVSRTPVREAFSILQHQGLLTVLPQRGSFVFRPQAQDIEALVAFRLHLELGAAQLALRTGQKAASVALSAAFHDMEQARENDDLQRYAAADTAFHQAFFDHCGNPHFKEAHDLIAGRISALRAHLSVPLRIHRTISNEEHKEILATFERGDAAAMATILTRHIEAMAGNYLRALDAI